ncbi:hypothetical protein Rhe02_48770 [Rhizocola hellebori]|uniref:Uncharacterized protein n=2 Tax=Rhizocola hellebori TaxID=1392758 RepID=A0A8J3QA93_9ACTN|nr:hypothetical protein Rhe02_48770 [Rhizocola hellebori]
MVGVVAAGCAAKPNPEPQTTGVRACAEGDLDTRAEWQRAGAAGGHLSPETKVHAKLNVRRGTFFDGDWQVTPATIKPGEPAALTVASGTGCNAGLGLIRYTEVEIVIGNRRWKLDGMQVTAEGHDYG